MKVRQQLKKADKEMRQVIEIAALVMNKRLIQKRNREDDPPE